jgi:DNA-binding XRE family transcriptional regulator
MPADKSNNSESPRASRRAPSSRLKALLRHFRVRIDPNQNVLGPQPRPTRRHGKPVTQEELAECLGVSRCWYGLLESERPVRVSIVLLDRLANVLMLTARERAMLFALAMPELDFSHAENRNQIVASGL